MPGSEYWQCNREPAKHTKRKSRKSAFSARSAGKTLSFHEPERRAGVSLASRLPADGGGFSSRAFALAGQASRLPYVGPAAGHSPSRTVFDMFRTNMSGHLASPPETCALLAGYQPVRGSYDELFTATGELRAHYVPFLRDLDKVGPAELKRRADTVRRISHEQGITYNVYGDARGIERPWQIDPVPFVIAADEWQALATALVQRATLINRILTDCYGAQELTRSHWLPPALVFAQPDFLRPCHGIRAPQDAILHFYAADLVRSPDGQWQVSSDRTQIPTGAGYALPNRLVHSRILPEPFRDEKVQRLAGFFRELQASLARLALRRTDNPRVVLLTPGPYNETYFEQAWLARYLGYMLVEGQDLTVRDDRVFLKTLSGLEPVDVILRRVDDDFCDPLELRNDSMLGVPGLLEALRAGNVAVANARSE